MASMAKRHHFIKEWRKFRGLTQEQLAGRLEKMPGEPLSHASVSRLEREIQPYQQESLEAVAVALNCTPAQLLSVNPYETPDVDLFRVIQGLAPDKRKQILDIARILAEQTQAA